MHKASSHTSRREAPQQRLQTANRADPNASPETMNAHTTSDSDQSSTESFLAHFFLSHAASSPLESSISRSMNLSGCLYR